MPRVQGGTGQYLLAGMGPLPSLIGNLSAYVITEILSMTAEITLCGLVLKGLFLPHVDNRIISINDGSGPIPARRYCPVPP